MLTMRHLRRTSSAAFILLWPICVLADDVSDYQLPLLGRYAIHYDSMWKTAQQAGPYRLINDLDLSGRTIVPDVKKIAVCGQVIAGEESTGYFLLNPDASNKPEYFQTMQQLQSALAALGITENIQLTEPDILAAKVPNQILRPWEYRMMRNLLGLSDGIWSVIVQLTGLCIAFLVGITSRNRGIRSGPLIGLGIVVNIVAMIVIGRGGGGALVGFLFFPLIYCIAAAIGKVIRMIVLFLWRTKPSSPPTEPL